MEIINVIPRSELTIAILSTILSTINTLISNLRFNRLLFLPAFSAPFSQRAGDFRNFLNQ